MSILNNAIESIQIGIEDYLEDEKQRYFSSVRNIGSGLLLLYKEKLLRLSPEHDKTLLIRRDIVPVRLEDGSISFEGKGKKTVDVQSIKERFLSLGITVDWNRFHEINNLRNEIEHYYTSINRDSIREIISKSFLLIRDFMVNELDEKPRELIGEESWDCLLDVKEVYDAEENDCRESLSKINWNYIAVEDSLEFLRCPECLSQLIEASKEQSSNFPLIELHCRSCGNDFSFDDVIEECVGDSLAGADFMSVKDGGEPVHEECPECFRSTFVHEHDCCVSCGYEMPYRNCLFCGESLMLEDHWNDGKCGYCQYKFDKVMAE